MKKLITGALVAISAHTVAGPLIFKPELSPDGNTIAFNYQGDVWTVSSDGGRANRLTIHEGIDSNPVWFSDSQTIAFNSDRYGNDDVFSMSATGGTPTRLTFHSADDVVTGVTHNGEVLFTTRRTYAQVEREWEVYSVMQDANSTETRFMDALGFDAVVSPDGSKVAFVRGTARFEREAYRGPANRNIWLYDKKTQAYTQLTSFDGNDVMPKWVGNDTLYYLTSESGRYNVHMMDLSGNSRQLTNEKAFGVNHFSTDQTDTVIVYHSADKIMKLNAETGKASELKIDVSTDYRFDPSVAKTVNDKIDQYSVSPNGKLTAYVHRGDIYVTRNDEKDKRSVRLTQGAAHDRDVVWLNDNALLFVSDRYGQNDLFLLTSSDESEKNLFVSLKTKIARVTHSEDDERAPVIAPDGNKIAFLQGRGKLITATIDASGALSDMLTLLDGWDTPSGVSWSPDSQYLAYSLSDLNFNEEVFIHPADNSRKPINVSMHPKRDANPVWSPDGSKLGFISSRNNSDADVWFVWLRKADWQRSQEEWREQGLMKDDKTNKPGKEEKEEDKEEVGSSVTVTIDVDGIYERLTQVTAFPANESQFVFSQDGEHVYYVVGGAGRQNFKADRSLYKIKWDGKDNKVLIDKDAEVEQLSLERSGKHVFALSKGGKLNRIDTKKDKNTVLPVISKVKIDYAAELEQIFDEGWRALNAGFYDPEFHGQDWLALRDAYKPLALKASTKEDFQRVFNLMLGQLNASHMGMYRGDNQKQTQRQTTGLLGIEGRHTEAGFEVTSVLADSPADREESRLRVGDVIKTVNQQPVANSNFYAHLIDTAKTPVLLQFERQDEVQEVVIWPVESLSNELYDAWVDERRRLTDVYSDGKLGYLHIRGMNWSSFERFERELMAAGYNKDGIVIDVRYNGGGWTTDYLMAVLNVKQHAYTIPRGAIDSIHDSHKPFENTYPFSERLPLAAWTKPSIAMSNENSYSNAEIFSHAYKALGLGKLVGRPTFGAVISTGGQRMVDGSLVRMPFRGWWVKATGENMERVPAKPDIEVFNPPAYKAKGVDPQLQRAVEELMKAI